MVVWCYCCSSGSDRHGIKGYYREWEFLVLPGVNHNRWPFYVGPITNDRNQEIG